jgi:lipopolysaccharide export system ATP-binding protein
VTELTLRLDNVQKSYGGRVIVKGASLSVRQGEVVGLLGPNGAGKTTTFYMATGLEKPDRGSVWLNQQAITHLPMHLRARLGIGYLAQEPSIFRRLNIRDNILLILEQSKVPRRLWRSRLDEITHDLNLGKVLNTMGSQVSGGERRRTELARALAMGTEGPKFLLLDEPFAGVDPIAVAEIQQIVASLRDRNLGILITDHNVRETLAITNRAYIMREGEIFAAGTSDDLYANALVRQYYLGEQFRY